MSVEAAGAGVTGQSSPRRPILTEGILLALSPVAAYTCAFFYERGYAYHFGYPSWLIEVSWIGVLGAWFTLLTAVYGVILLALLALSIPPASVAGLFWNRASGALGGLLLLWLFLWGLLIAMPEAHGLWVLNLAFVGALILFLLIRLFWLYRTAPKENTRSARWATATRMFVMRAPHQEISLADAFLKRHLFGRPLSFFIGCLLLVALVILPPYLLGRVSARFERQCLVTHGLSDWVAIRKYGDNILAMQLDAKTMTVARNFILFPLADTARVWSSNLCRLQVPPLDIR